MEDWDNDFPVRLPCGDIFGGVSVNFLKIPVLAHTAKQQQCLFNSPAPSAPPLAEPHREAILKGVLRSGKIFFAEMVLDSDSDQSYDAFKRWAQSRDESHRNFIALIVARTNIGQLEGLAARLGN